MSGGLFLLFRLPQNFYLVKTKGGFKIEKASFLVGSVKYFSHFGLQGLA